MRAVTTDETARAAIRIELVARVSDLANTQRAVDVDTFVAWPLLDPDAPATPFQMSE